MTQRSPTTGPPFFFAFFLRLPAFLAVRLYPRFFATFGAFLAAGFLADFVFVFFAAICVSSVASRSLVNSIF